MRRVLNVEGQGFFGKLGDDSADDEMIGALVLVARQAGEELLQTFIVGAGAGEKGVVVAAAEFDELLWFAGSGEQAVAKRDGVADRRDRLWPCRCRVHGRAQNHEQDQEELETRNGAMLF